MQLVAHRGFALEAPENTLTAVEHAANSDATAIEVDVRVASDGTPVVVHDASLSRVTDRDGPVSDYAPSTLAAVNVLGSNDGIPTLAAVLALASELGLAVNVELKEPPVAAATVDVIRNSPIPTNAVWVSSFERPALERVAAATEESGVVAGSEPDAGTTGLSTAYLTDTRRSNPVETAVSLGCDAIHPQYGLTFAGDLVDRAHDAGLHVYAWTLASPWVARAVTYRQVDGLIANVAFECNQQGLATG